MRVSYETRETTTPRWPDCLSRDVSVLSRLQLSLHTAPLSLLLPRWKGGARPPHDACYYLQQQYQQASGRVRGGREGDLVVPAGVYGGGGRGRRGGLGQPGGGGVGGRRRARQHHRPLPARHLQDQIPGRRADGPGRTQVQVSRSPLLGLDFPPAAGLLVSAIPIRQEVMK